MKYFSFRTLLDDKIFGEGTFAFPDLVDEKLNIAVSQSELTDFTYSDPAVGSFNLSNLHVFRLVIGAISSDCFFSIVMSKPDGLDAIVSSFVQPSILGVVAGKSIKLEWPISCSAMLVQESIFPSSNSGQVSLTTKLKENRMTDANTVVTLSSVSEVRDGDPIIATVNSDSHPPIPARSKGTFTPSPDTGARNPTCNVIKFNGLTYWAYSYDDNRIGMNIVAYDAANKVVKQWEKTGARYLWKITTDTANQTVTFHGQASQIITMKWSDLAVA